MDVPDFAPAAPVVKHVFLHNMRAAGLTDLIEPVQATSDDAFETLAKRRFDLVYVDGDHAYDQVRRDLANACRVLAPNGIICGDDLEVQANEVAEPVLAEALAQRLSWADNPDTRTGFHPGVTQAVYESFGPVSAWGGFWAICERNGSWEPIVLDGIDAPLPLPLLQYDENGRRLFDL